MANTQLYYETVMYVQNLNEAEAVQPIPTPRTPPVLSTGSPWISMVDSNVSAPPGHPPVRAPSKPKPSPPPVPQRLQHHQQQQHRQSSDAQPQHQNQPPSDAEIPHFDIGSTSSDAFILVSEDEKDIDITPPTDTDLKKQTAIDITPPEATDIKKQTAMIHMLLLEQNSLKRTIGAQGHALADMTRKLDLLIRMHSASSDAFVLVPHVTTATPTEPQPNDDESVKAIDPKASATV